MTTDTIKWRGWRFGLRVIAFLVLAVAVGADGARARVTAPKTAKRL